MRSFHPFEKTRKMKDSVIGDTEGTIHILRNTEISIFHLGPTYVIL